MQSLVALDLLDKDGKPTEQLLAFRSIRGDDEYRARLQEWVRGVYADVLMYADPSSSSYDDLTEAFRTYEPAGQRRAMATLLLGLWKHAGLPVPTTAVTVQGRATPRKATRRPPTANRPTRREDRQSLSSQQMAADSTAQLGGLPPGLVGLLHQIPTSGRGWAKDTRDNFVLAFTAVLDFTIPIRPIGLEDLTEDDFADPGDEDDEP